jgi:hypothetical protein
MTSRARLMAWFSQSTRRQRRVLIFSLIGLVVSSTAALASVPTPTVSVPPAGTKGFPFLTSSIDRPGTDRPRALQWHRGGRVAQCHRRNRYRTGL